MPIVKHSLHVQDPATSRTTYTRRSTSPQPGAPGPVLVDVPQDLSRADIDYEPITDEPDLRGYKPSTEGNIKQIRLAARALASARRPVIYAGGRGQREYLGRAARSLPRLFPSHLHGDGARGVRPRTSSGSGCSGCRTRSANYSMDNADLIVAIGARFDDRITGKLSEFAPRASSSTSISIRPRSRRTSRRTSRSSATPRRCSRSSPRSTEPSERIAAASTPGGIKSTPGPGRSTRSLTRIPRTPRSSRSG